MITLKQEDVWNMPEEESSSLGLQWHIKQDVFSVKVVLKDRSKTKAGVLGHIGAVFDPLGIVAPAKLILRLINREIEPRLEEDPHCIKALDWYDQLPAAFDKQWIKLVETCTPGGRKCFFCLQPRKFR